MGAIIDCIAGRWSPEIGDPTIVGWVTVIGYAATSLLTIRVGFLNRGRVLRVFWLVLAVLMAFLAVNKQLDLQSVLTAAGRCHAKLNGWYGSRHFVQIGFIGALLVTTTLVLLAMIVKLRAHLGQIGLAVAGVAFLLAFISIRAVGFHDVDRFIGLSIENIRVNWILELGGIALIALNAAAFLLRKESPKKHHP